MIFESISKDIAPTTFHLDGLPVKFTDEYTYVGVTFVSHSVNIFAKHYANKSNTAHSIANVTFSMDSFVGSLLPFEGKCLHTARVDPHLISACEICLDVNVTLLAPLQKIQHTYFRRLLGLLLQGRLEYDENGVLTHQTLRFRHYCELPFQLIESLLHKSSCLTICLQKWCLDTLKDTVHLCLGIGACAGGVKMM
jgi:hypothetical protein